MSAPLDACLIPTSGIQLIEASAGTGKTYTITSLFLRLIAEVGLDLEQVAAVTFTNAATEELKERVQLRLTRAVGLVREGVLGGGDSMVEHLLGLPQRQLVLRRLEEALRVIDRVSIFTIHGFAARTLAQHAFESGARTDLDLLPDDRGILFDVVTDFWAAEVATLPPEQYVELGADASHSGLIQVARTMAGAFEVPLAAAARAPDFGAEVERFGALRRQVSVLFREQGAELEALLASSPALNRNTYRPGTVAKDAEALRRYLAEERPAARAYPDLKAGRWTTAGVVRGTKVRQVPPTHPLLDRLQELREAAEGVVLGAAALGASLRSRLAQELERRLSREHELGKTQSFDGLLVALLQSLRREGSGETLAASIRARYPAILIDEFQDTDKAQYEIFRRVFGSGDEATVLYLIGDPKQSIYRFRGADIQTYLRAAREASGSIWTLDVSYRSSPDLVRAQNVLFLGCGRPFAHPEIRYAAVQAAPQAANRLVQPGSSTPPPALRIVECLHRDPYERAAVEAAMLLSSGLELDGRAISPGNLAVLTRTNKQAEIVQSYLRELGIPAVMHGDRSVFEAPEAFELRRILRALAEPNQRELSRAALATRFLGVTASELFSLKEDTDLLESWTGRLRALSDLWRSRGVAHALEALASAVDLVPRTLREVDGERRMTNYRHLLELLHEAERKEHLGVVGLLRWFDTAIAAPTGHAMAPEARQVRLESDEDAVTLTTAHKSKGLEYDIVLLPSIGTPEREFSSTAVRFHDANDDDREKVEVRSKGSSPEVAEHFEQGRVEELEEALRVGYVALTRARHQVICFYQMPKRLSPLGWLIHERHLPADTDSALLRGMSELSLEQKNQDLERLVAESAGRIARSAEEDAPPLAEMPVQNRTPFRGFSLFPPPPPPVLPESQITSSFSAMTRVDGGLSRNAEQGRDLDEVEELRVGAEPARGAASVQRSADRVLLADFPRGSGPGNALHAVFEHLPFRDSEPSERRRIVSEQLSVFGYQDEHSDAVFEAVERTLHLPLLGGSVRLLDLARSETVREMEFSLTVGADRSALPSARSLSGGVLRQALGTTPEPYLSEGYLKRVRDLGFGAFRGYLRGFIDLVFVVGEKFYVLDYKSNYLGETYGDYDRAAMQRSMEDHHYLLQGLLYAVAVQQYARTRLPDYAYERHFGGVIYLYLRGIGGEGEAATGAVQPATGVYDFRPSEQVLEALSRWLGASG